MLFIYMSQQKLHTCATCLIEYLLQRRGYTCDLYIVCLIKLYYTFSHPLSKQQMLCMAKEKWLHIIWTFMLMKSKQTVIFNCLNSVQINCHHQRFKKSFWSLTLYDTEWVDLQFKIYSPCIVYLSKKGKVVMTINL